MWIKLKNNSEGMRGHFERENVLLLHSPVIIEKKGIIKMEIFAFSIIDLTMCTY